MMAKVSYSKGRTVNLGNFESTRIDISIELECQESEIDATYERCHKWVDNKVRQQEQTVRTE